jgi:hypothetical protein
MADSSNSILELIKPKVTCIFFKDIIICAASFCVIRNKFLVLRGVLLLCVRVSGCIILELDHSHTVQCIDVECRWCEILRVIVDALLASLLTVH